MTSVDLECIIKICYYIFFYATWNTRKNCVMSFHVQFWLQIWKSGCRLLYWCRVQVRDGEAGHQRVPDILYIVYMVISVCVWYNCHCPTYTYQLSQGSVTDQLTSKHLFHWRTLSAFSLKKIVFFKKMLFPTSTNGLVGMSLGLPEPWIW